MIGEFNVEKWVWATNDFEKMGWHDCKIHGIAFDEFNFKILFDIDYIFKWVVPAEDKCYHFWVSPATLIFENVHDLNIDLSYDMSTVIESLDRGKPNKPLNSDFIKKEIEWEWLIETTNGQISFKSIGYVQHIRKVPVYQASQEIGFEERGGYSFKIESMQ